MIPRWMTTQVDKYWPIQALKMAGISNQRYQSKWHLHQANRPQESLRAYKHALDRIVLYKLMFILATP